MSHQIQTLFNKGLTPSRISESVGSLGNDLDIDEMFNFHKVIHERLNVTLTKLATTMHNKKITVVLNSILNELEHVVDGDAVFLEKYLIDNSNPVIQANVTYTATVYDTLKTEMLELFRLIGYKQTVLLYLLVMYHMG